MNVFRIVLPWLVIAAGIVGTAVCVAVAFVVWSISASAYKLEREAFSQVDQSIETMQQQLTLVQRQVQQTAAATDAVGQRVSSWGESKTTSQMLKSLNLQQKAEQIGVVLQEANHRLIGSLATMDALEKVIEVAASSGFLARADLGVPARKVLDDLRIKLIEGNKVITRIQQVASSVDESQSLAAQAEEITQLMGRVVATMREVDRLLGEALARLSAARSHTVLFAAKLYHWQFLVQLVIGVAIIWCAAGQGALCLLGWRAAARR